MRLHIIALIPYSKTHLGALKELIGVYHALLSYVEYLHDQFYERHFWYELIGTNGEELIPLTEIDSIYW